MRAGKEARGREREKISRIFCTREKRSSCAPSFYPRFLFVIAPFRFEVKRRRVTRRTKERDRGRGDPATGRGRGEARRNRIGRVNTCEIYTARMLGFYLPACARRLDRQINVDQSRILHHIFSRSLATPDSDFVIALALVSCGSRKKMGKKDERRIRQKPALRRTATSEVANIRLARGQRWTEREIYMRGAKESERESRIDGRRMGGGREDSRAKEQESGGMEGLSSRPTDMHFRPSWILGAVGKIAILVARDATLTGEPAPPRRRLAYDVCTPRGSRSASSRSISRDRITPPFPGARASKGREGGGREFRSRVFGLSSNSKADEGIPPSSFTHAHVAMHEIITIMRRERGMPRGERKIEGKKRCRLAV